jgi:hypothetical protein
MGLLTQICKQADVILRVGRDAQAIVVYIAWQIMFAP